jgi:glycosyltransferase involved in cell wall biosynthesis
MRILVVSPTPSHPQDAGNRARIHALLTALTEAGHAVHLCLLTRENPSPAAIAAMRAAWAEVVLVPHDRAAEASSLAPLHAIDDWVLPETEAAFVDLAARTPGFDMVLVEYVFLSRAFEHFPDSVLKVLDTHDVFGGRAEALAELGLENRFFATTPAEEARGLDRAHLVLAIQREEARVLAGRTARPVLTLGHLPPEAPPLPPRRPDGRLVLGWIGSANPLNTRAIGRFLDALPPGQLASARAEIVLAGGGATALGRGEEPGLRVLGPVASADALYGQVDLVVNPHEGGTGLKVKTVEALARGRPVIGTDAAFAGLPATAAGHAARDAPDLARLVAAMLRDPWRRAGIARASAHLQANYAAATRNAMAQLARPAALRMRLAEPRGLIVTDVPWWRGTLGNHARILALLEAARAEMAVDVFFAGDVGAERDAAEAALPGGVRLVLPEAGGTATPPWGLTPFERARFDGALYAALASHLARQPPRMLLLEYLRLSWMRLAPSQLAPYLALPGGAAPLLVLDTHDLMALRAQNFARFGQVHFIQIGTAEELRILSQFHQVLAIQSQEAAWLEKLLPGRVVLAPHAEPARPRATGGSGPPRVGFLGGDSPMNRDGLRWFLDQVWPAIAPLGATLHVAGGVCAGMPARAGVTLHGEVPDAAAFLAGLDIAVNPVAYGGGLKIKTVEYLAHGLPSVLTAEALFGVSGGAGHAYHLAANRAEFVASLARLVLDPRHRAGMAEAAHAFGRTHFGPDALAPAMRLLAGLARGVPEPVA